MQTTDALRVPPHSAEAEQSVLGGLLLDNSAWDRVADFIHADHFYRYDHRIIFEHIVRLINNAKPADVITVFESLDSVGKAEELGGLSYLNALAQNTPSAANIRRYAEIVHDRSQKRQIITACHQVVDLVEGSQMDAAAMIDQLSSKLEQLVRAPQKREPALASSTLAEHIESIDARYHGAEPEAISTGLVDLDKRLNGGLRRGNLIILAARPKMGKTALALNIANHVATTGTAGVLSMEMTLRELHDRNIASIGGIHLDHLIDPKQLTNEDWPRLTHAVQRISNMSLFLDDQPGLTLMDVRTKAKFIKRRMGLDLLVVDYLQLMSGEGDNRNAQIEGITRGLKNLAKELDVPIILLSQLNRKLEDRPNKRPQPADLRDSGSIEQDADIAIFLYRDEVYNPDSMDKGVCEANIALNRQGAAGIVPLTYIGEQTKFADLHREWQPPAPKQPSRRGVAEHL
jgi:replicative DNA helicase